MTSRKVLPILVPCLSLSLTASCKHRHEHDTQEHESKTTEAPPAPTDGTKWKANPETTRGIARMRTLIRKARNASPSGVPDLSTTARELRETYQTIFRECTMTGPAHDRLHDYLVPLTPLLKNLEKPGAGERELTALEQRLAEYDEHFE